MSVNQPLRYGGVTAYQTDWSMSALTVRAVGSPLQPPDGSPFNLPMANLIGKAGAWQESFEGCGVGRGLKRSAEWESNWAKRGTCMV
jgi:hypothetical protein